MNRAGAQRAGISDWQLRHRETLRLSRDTYVPGSSALDPRQRIDAVLLGSPASAVLSHHSAAAMWGLQVPLVADDGRVHLTVPPQARVRSRADRIVHCSKVPAAETRTLHGRTLTSSGRTWLDLAAVVPPAALLAVTDQLLARGFPAGGFQRILGRAGGRRGVASARRILPFADRRAGSPMESVLRWLILDAGLPQPVLQYIVRDRKGRFLGQVDLAWPEHRLIVEFDGDLHRDRSVFVRDVRRQNGIVLAGWQILRFTSADVLGRDRATIGTIAGALRPA